MGLPANSYKDTVRKAATMSGKADYKPRRGMIGSEILQRKDFWSSALYVVIGAGTIAAASRYEFGSPSNMGPGFFPIVLGSLLVVIGGTIALRVISGGEKAEARIGFVNWKALALISAATVAFGLLLPLMGVLVALPALMLMGAAASRHFRMEPRAIAGMLLLSGICALVFVIGLGVPMPLLGSLFGG